MNWFEFPVTAKTSGALWLLSGLIVIMPSKEIKVCGGGIIKFIRIIGGNLPVISKKNKLIISNILSITGIILFLIFIIFLWKELERPPLRTLGETRLWYAFFLPVIGIITYNKWKYGWFLIFVNLMSLLFLYLNLIHPENFNKTLMPALQSVWFAPHVLVYILSYALLGASFVTAVYGLLIQLLKFINTTENISFSKLKRYIDKVKCEELSQPDYKLKLHKILNLADNIVYIGFAFLTFGLLFGALWAKEAWGHYWTWDPKETWALLTFLVYLIYIHLRSYHKRKTILHLWVLSISFVFLLSAWFGVNYMPSSKNSVHTYSQQE